MNKFYSHLIKHAHEGHGAHSPVATPAAPAAPAAPAQPQPNPALQDGIVRRVSPRQAYSAAYGPELTEAMRQRAEAYQKTHQADLQRASSDYGTLMPNYSTQYFNRPLTVLNDTSISPGGYAYPGMAAGPTFGSRMREAVSYLPFTRPAHDVAIRSGVADLNRGLPENTRRYNSMLIHEMTHALQKLNKGDWNEALVPPLMQPRLLPNESDDLSSAYRNYNYKLPYSRYPVELAPVVAQAKMDYYEAMKPNLKNPADAMNFDNPEAYQRFLEWIKDRPDFGPKTNNYGSSSDVKWILDLEPWERDLYFRGVASNQQQQPQGEKLAYTKPAPYDHYVPPRMKRAQSPIQYSSRQQEIMQQYPHLFPATTNGHDRYYDPSGGYSGLVDHMNTNSLDAARRAHGAFINSNSVVENDKLTDELESSTFHTFPSAEANALAEFYGHPQLFQPRVAGATQEPYVNATFLNTVKNDGLMAPKMVDWYTSTEIPQPGSVKATTRAGTPYATYMPVTPPAQATTPAQTRAPAQATTPAQTRAPVQATTPAQTRAPAQAKPQKQAAHKDHNDNSGFLNEWKDAFEIARRLNSSSETSRQADTDSELDIWLGREFSKRPHLTHEEKLNALAEKLYLVNSALEGGAKRKPPSITQSVFDSPSWQG